MLLSQKETLEDIVARHLLAGPQGIKQLHHAIAATESVTIRAIYKAVNSLISSHVCIKVGKKVWIDQEWLQKVRNVLTTPIPQLGEGEKSVYSFTSISHLDAFWKTIAFQLETFEQGSDVFFYNPHNFWAYVPARRESEDAYYAHFRISKQRAYFVIGGKTGADMQFKRAYQNEYLQINTTEVTGFSRRDHITILGEHIVTVRLPITLARKIDALYQMSEDMDFIIPQIVKETDTSGNVRLTVERSAHKANKLRASLVRGFHVPTLAARENLQR